MPLDTALAAPAFHPFLPIDGTDPIRRARHYLEQCRAEPGLVLNLPLRRKPGSYERNFLFGDASMSIWAMVWEPGAATSIHDHHCSCCFTVLTGQLTERWFERVGTDTVVTTAVALRQPGFLACMLPTGPNIHQMLNTGSETAISVHVYGFDPAQHASSVEREYRLLPPQ